jgi:hypothetical protein
VEEASTKTRQFMEAPLNKASFGKYFPRHIIPFMFADDLFRVAAKPLRRLRQKARRPGGIANLGDESVPAGRDN